MIDEYDKLYSRNSKLMWENRRLIEKNNELKEKIHDLYDKLLKFKGIINNGFDDISVNFSFDDINDVHA